MWPFSEGSLEIHIIMTVSTVYDIYSDYLYSNTLAIWKHCPHHPSSDFNFELCKPQVKSLSCEGFLEVKKPLNATALQEQKLAMGVCSLWNLHSLDHHGE